MVKTITTYPSGEKVEREFTEEEFKQFCKDKWYFEEVPGLFISETDFGFNHLRVVQ